IWASAHLASGSETKDLHQLQGWWHARPNGLDDLAAAAGLANSLTVNDTLGPAKAHLVEIEIGMLRTDMMKHAGDGAADPGIEAFHRIDVNRIANILATGMVHRLMICKAFTDRHECLRFIAHQPRIRVDLRFGRTLCRSQ